MQLPPPIKSFLNKYQADLTGKMIVPFNNNAGYGMGQSLVQFNQYCRRCLIMQSIELRGGIERANQAKNTIAKWLQDLSINNPVIQQLLKTMQQTKLSFKHDQSSL